jgi:hypothetical protein
MRKSGFSFSLALSAVKYVMNSSPDVSDSDQR